MFIDSLLTIIDYYNVKNLKYDNSTKVARNVLPKRWNSLQLPINYDFPKKIIFEKPADQIGWALDKPNSNDIKHVKDRGYSKNKWKKDNWKNQRDLGLNPRNG